MTLLAIIKFFAVAFGCVITVLGGILLMRHRQLIDYFKSAFTFIREDYQPDMESEHGHVISESINALRYGMRSLRKSDNASVFGKDETLEINKILVLIGKLLVATGILGIIIIFIGTIWMLSTSHINVDLY